MQKSQISILQATRIKANRDEQLKDAQKGLLVCNHGATADVFIDQKVKQYPKLSKLEPIVPGDYVGIENNTIIGNFPRKSVLYKKTHTKFTPLAANIDQVFITTAIKPAPNLTTIDRYILACEYYKIEPIIVFNKADILYDNADDSYSQLFNLYNELGYKVIKCSIYEVQSFTALAELTQNKISVFVGQSGVGKSSLISHLTNTNILSGSLNKQDFGTHTTSCTTLYFTNTDGYIIDSPGVREFQLPDLTPQELAMLFVEFRAHLDDCKYRDCLHIDNNECGIIAAFNRGLINNRRFQSYRLLLNLMQQPHN